MQSHALKLPLFCQCAETEKSFSYRRSVRGRVCQTKMGKRCSFVTQVAGFIPHTFIELLEADIFQGPQPQGM